MVPIVEVEREQGQVIGTDSGILGEEGISSLRACTGSMEGGRNGAAVLSDTRAYRVQTPSQPLFGRASEHTFAAAPLFCPAM